MKQMRDVDTGEVAQKFKTFAYSAIGGGIGMMLGSAAGGRFGAPVAGAFIGFVVGWLGMYLIVFGAADRIGTAASSIYMAAGSSTPPARQYSLAQSYAARGQFEQAAAEYERCADEHPDDPEPPLRLGRLYRDELQRHEDAVRWFKRACAIPNLPAPTDIMVTRELIEIYTHHMKQPASAAPLLARLATRHPHSPAAEWAKRELAVLRAELHSGTSAPPAPPPGS